MGANVSRRLGIVLAAVTMGVSQAAIATPATGIGVTGNPLVIGASLWELLLISIGSSAAAESFADNDHVRDPPAEGTSNGGAGRTSALAEAPAAGNLGSKLTTHAEGNVNPPFGNAQVSFPVRQLGNVTPTARPSYDGVGSATGGTQADFKRAFPQQAAGPQAAAPPDSVLSPSFLLTFTLDHLMLAAEGAGSESASFGLDIYATTDPQRTGNDLTPNSWFFHQRYFASSARLTSDGQLTLGGDYLRRDMFSDASFVDAAFAVSLLSPLSFLASVEFDVPQDVSAFTLVALTSAEQSASAAASGEVVAEPAVLWLLALGAALGGLGRSHRATSLARPAIDPSEDAAEKLDWLSGDSQFPSLLNGAVGA